MLYQQSNKEHGHPVLLFIREALEKQEWFNFFQNFGTFLLDRRNFDFFDVESWTKVDLIRGSGHIRIHLSLIVTIHFLDGATYT